MSDISCASALGCSLWLMALGLTLWGAVLSRKLLKGFPPHLDAPFNLYPVSIIKPLKGVDSRLEANLESFFKLDYPDFELLFCVAHSLDPALVVAERLMARYPKTKSRILVGETMVGVNPKINNMVRAYDDAANDWILISDSNVRVESDYLKRLVAYLDPGVGMVTAVVVGLEGEGVGGNLEATYLNTFYTRAMCLAAAIGKECVLGKSMLFQRTVAERFGGLRTLGCYLAEDYMAGEAIRRLGLKIVTVSDPVRQIIGHHSLNDFWQRHLRWGRIRKRHGMGAFIIEPVSGAIVSGLIGAAALHDAFGMNVSTFLVFHLGLWSACDLMQMRWMRAPLKWSTPIFWFLREILALPLWIHIASGNTVNWRGHRLALGVGGILEDTPTAAQN